MRRLAFLVVALAACDVGEVGPANNGSTDGGASDGATGDGSNALACIDRSTPVGAAHIHATGGTANAGQNCMMAGCHITGGTGPLYGAMGTVYKADNVTPNGGVVVRLAFGGMTKTAVTDDAGNFMFSSTLAATYPAATDSSACPDMAKMVTPITSAVDLNCNRGGCHDNATNRINFQ